MKAYVLNIAERCENMTTISLRMDDEMKRNWMKCVKQWE